MASNGYGQINRLDLGGRWTTHSLAYTATYGPPPIGTEIDHTCHNDDVECPGGKGCIHRRCCNPRHLQAIHPRENKSRADSQRGRAQYKEVCPKGHHLDGVLTRKSGPRAGAVHRYCKTCNRENQARRKEAH